MSRKRRTAASLMRHASKRQRRLYGLNAARVPEHESWRLELDEKYLAALAKDPEAALFLSVFHEEIGRGVAQEGEPHLHTDDEIRELERGRHARRRNRDVLAFDAYRSDISTEELECCGDENPESVRVRAFHLQRTRLANLAETEDAAIAKIDAERAVALRRGDD